MTYDPGSIGESELITRFGYDSGYYRTNRTAKTKAFEPDENDEVSVFRIDDVSGERLWALGDAARNRRAKASIQIVAEKVYDVGLNLSIAEPPVRHAVIDGWPVEHLRIQKQQELADAAEVVFRPV